MTVEDIILLDEWLPVVEVRLKTSTAGGYRHIVTKRLIPHLGDARLSQLAFHLQRAHPR